MTTTSDTRAGEQGRSRPGRIIVSANPLNAEIPPDAWQHTITPTDQFYVRSHFAAPQADADSWSLQLSGALEGAREVTLAELRALPTRTLTATMECAGNDRLGFAPLCEGEPWGSGAVSTGVWTGVALRDLLARVRLRPTAVELLFTGADAGAPPDSSGALAFERSLPLAKALDPDTLLAFELNGAPLPHIHGGPLRLVVPGWYGMASVKWLTRITALEQPFAGYFQRERYVLVRPGEAERVPLGAMAVKSRITAPSEGATLPMGSHTVSGVAWSGSGVARVEVRVDHDGAWQAARLHDGPRYAWRRWEWTWEADEPGKHVLQVRATDEAGNTQPDVAAWNQFGYVNNAIQSVVVYIGEREAA
nr:MAG: sulfite oxidase [Chloroflexota bacterium]